MAKKQKNKGRLESLKRKAIASEEMANIGLDLSDDLTTIGIIFNHLGISHLNYTGIVNINNLCRSYSGVDISIFSQHMIPPCVQPLCPVFNISSLIRWNNYPLISTDITTTKLALSSNASRIYYYAFDPEFLYNTNTSITEIEQTFIDPRISVVVRHEDHKKLVESEFGIKTCEIIIPDFHIENFVKFILLEMKKCQI